MDQLKDLADDRLINSCIYCGDVAETRDHVPSRCLLEQPYPENLPVVGCCDSCNQGFSKDEEYLICLLEAVLCGFTNPNKIKRPSVARIMRRSPALRARIEAAKIKSSDGIKFAIEPERIKNVMLKLARGHAAYELSQPCRDDPDYFWCGPLELLTKEQFEEFDAAHFPTIFGEVGSRNMQRMLVTQITFKSETGQQKQEVLLMNDWIDVQKGLYRFLAIDDREGVIIRIVLSEYLGCEVAWLKEGRELGPFN